MDRDDYFAQVKTSGPESINISANDYGDDDKQHCLIQVGIQDGALLPWRSAYLTDDEVKALIWALVGYLAATPRI